VVELYYIRFEKGGFTSIWKLSYFYLQLFEKGNTAKVYLKGLEIK